MEGVFGVSSICTKTNDATPISLVENAHVPIFYSEILTKKLKILKKY